MLTELHQWFVWQFNTIWLGKYGAAWQKKKPDNFALVMGGSVIVWGSGFGGRHGIGWLVSRVGWLY